jgi:hypothetical protein
VPRLIALGLVSFAVGLLGVRLLGLARRTGAAPERWLGAAFLLAGASGWLLPLAALEPVSHDVARRIALAGQAGLGGAVCCLVAFACTAFHAGSAAARALALALVAANASGVLAVIASGTPVPTAALGFFVLLARRAGLLWLFAESARYAVLMRRRVRIGLGDPVVANRFVLWSIWTGALALIPLFVLALRAAGVLGAVEPGAPLPPGMRAALAALGMGGAVAFGAGWLAFFPPVAYLRWVGAARTA